MVSFNAIFRGGLSKTSTRGWLTMFVGVHRPCASWPGECFTKCSCMGLPWKSASSCLGRFVDIGAELFAMSATLARTQAMVERSDPEAPSALDLSDYFCRSSQIRIARMVPVPNAKRRWIGLSPRRKVLADLPQTLSEGS